MRRYFKKAVLFLTAASMVASLLTSCNTGKTSEKNPATGVNQDEAPVTGLPIVDKPTTLKYWGELHVQAAQFIRDHNENEVYQEMEKKTGIHIEWIHPAANQVGEQFNLMIAAGDLPDIIQGAGSYKGGIMKGVDDKVYLDATPYMKKYAPDYWKLINSDKEIKREVTFDNGAVPAFYQIKPGGDPPWRRMIANKTWLAELGMQVPKTFDDWEKYFKDIKDKKNIPVGFFLAVNGQEDVISGAFGVLNAWMLKDGKEVTYGKLMPGYKDYLTLMNKWFTYGYISKDFVAKKEPQQQAEFNSNRAGCIIASVDSMFNDSKAAGVEMTPAPFPRIKADDQLHWKGPDWPATARETVVTADSKYKTEAIRWLNYAYSDDGARLFNYGIEGKSYTMVNGKPQYTDYMLKNTKYPLPPANYILRVHFAPKLTFSDLVCNPSVLADPAGVANRLMFADDKKIDGLYTLPPVKMTLEESDRRAQIMTDVNSYANQMVLKFITGAEPLSKFDEFVKQMKDLGIDEAIKITQASYERHMKN